MASDYYRVTDWRTRAQSLGHSAGVVVAAFLIGVVFQGLALVAFRQAGVVTSIETLPPVATAVLSAAQFVGFGVAVAGYLWWRDERDLFSIGVPDLSDLVWTVVGGVALFLAASGVSLVVRALGAETATNQIVELGQQNPRLFLYLIPVTIVFVAPAEEFLFRGIVQGLFRRAYGLVPGLVFASVFFGVAHWLALTGGGKLTYVAIATVLGLVLGAAYERTENLVVPILIHGGWNALLFGTQYLVATGAVQP